MRTMTAAAIKSLFANKLVTDDREPILTFVVPVWNEKFAILAPQVEFWSQLLPILLIQTIIACLFAIPIYKYIVQQRPCSTPQYLLGFGVVVPFACWIPFLLLGWLEIQNCVLKLSVVTLPSIVVFRCIEAMYNTSLNTAVEASLVNYVTYSSSLVHAVWNVKTGKRVKATRVEILSNMWTLLCQFCILSILLSYLSARNYQPFDSNVQLDEFHIRTLVDLVQPGQVLNNYLVALLTFYSLCVGFNMVGILNNLQGYSVVDMLYNPMLCTSSVSDFWRSKWNPVVGGALKRAAFLPVRKYYSARIAILATFFTSGLLHDYSWACIFYRHVHQYSENGDCVVDCFYPLPWKQTAFFGYCGMIVLGQGLVRNWKVVQWISKTLPLPIVSTLVILTVLPISHWYTGDWIVGGYFDDFRIGLLQIVPIEE